MADQGNQSGPLKSRSHNRLPCQSTGEFFLSDGKHEVQLIDISSGGCKIKLPGAPDGGVLAKDLPVEFVLTIGSISVQGGIVWFMSGMFGCTFFDHIMLDTIALIMGHSFRIRLLPKNTAE